jgi:hypothetical protein
LLYSIWEFNCDVRGLNTRKVCVCNGTEQSLEICCTDWRCVDEDVESNLVPGFGRVGQLHEFGIRAHEVDLPDRAAESSFDIQARLALGRSGSSTRADWVDET